MPPALLVEEFRPLVGSIVNKLRRQLSMQVAVEDLEAYGFEGLLDAQNRFDPDDGSYFAAYAYYRIRGNILDGCRREGWIGRHRLASARRMRAIDELMESTGEADRDAPRPATLAEAVDRVANLVDAAATVFLLSDTDMDRVLPVQPSQLDGIQQEANRALLSRALTALSDEEREVIHRHHFDEQSMDEIATFFDRSRSWVSRVNTRALAKLKDHILRNE